MRQVREALGQWQRGVSLLLLLLGSWQSARANETETTGIGARSSGLAGAVVATVNDPSAVYYNPAGLVNLKEPQIWFDFTVFSLAGSSDNPQTGEEFDFSLPSGVLRPTLIAGGPFLVQDTYWGIGLIGVSGLAGQFPKDSGENRFSGFSSKLLQTTITPSLSYQVLPNLAVGATAEISAFTKAALRARFGDGYVGDFIKSKQGVSIDTRDGRDDATLLIASDEDFPTGLRPHNTLAADFRSASFVAGATYQPLSFLTVGLAYKHKSEPTLRGTTAILLDASAREQTGLPDPVADFDTSFVMRPRMINLGTALEFTPGWILHVEGQWSQWSAEEEMRFEFAGEGLLGQKQLVIPLAWHDTWSPRIALEHIFPSGKRLWAGYWLDKDPAPRRTYFAPFLPGDVNMLSAGLALPQIFGPDLDVALYAQVGILTGTNLQAGESVNAGGLKNLEQDASGGLKLGTNETPLRYHNARLYTTGISFTYRLGSWF